MTAAQRQQWHDDGVLIIPSFFDDAQTQAVQDELDALRLEREPANPISVDVLAGALQGKRIWLHDAPDDLQQTSHKVNDVYLRGISCQSLLLGTKLQRVLRELLNDEPVLINSLNFQKGSGQPLHLDTFFMPPPVENAMAVASICLEDTHPDSGPVAYVAGSHEIEPYRFPHGGLHQGDYELDPAIEHIEREVEARGLQTKTFLGQRGDLLIWHANLYHGGTPIKDRSRTRRSLVAHFWGQTGVTNPLGAGGDGGQYLLKPNPAEA